MCQMAHKTDYVVDELYVCCSNTLCLVHYNVINPKPVSIHFKGYVVPRIF
jgi:hypothetical protein